jgi:hypothetical protein
MASHRSCEFELLPVPQTLRFGLASEVAQEAPQVDRIRYSEILLDFPQRRTGRRNRLMQTLFHLCSGVL